MEKKVGDGKMHQQHTLNPDLSATQTKQLYSALTEFKECIHTEMEKIQRQIKNVKRNEEAMKRIYRNSIGSLEELRRDIHETLDYKAVLFKKEKRFHSTLLNIDITPPSNKNKKKDEKNHVGKNSQVVSKSNENLVYLSKGKIGSLEKELGNKEVIAGGLKDQTEKTKVRIRVE